MLQWTYSSPFKDNECFAVKGKQDLLFKNVIVGFKTPNYMKSSQKLENSVAKAAESLQGMHIASCFKLIQ